MRTQTTKVLAKNKKCGHKRKKCEHKRKKCGHKRKKCRHKRKKCGHKRKKCGHKRKKCWQKIKNADTKGKNADTNDKIDDNNAYKTLFVISLLCGCAFFAIFFVFFVVRRIRSGKGCMGLCFLEGKRCLLLDYCDNNIKCYDRNNNSGNTKKI